MVGRMMFDTNVVIGMLRQDHSVQELFSQVDEILLSNVVLGELYFGARKSARVEENLNRINRLAGDFTITISDTITSQVIGEIKSQLQAKGRMIPENDIWIAASAIQHGLALATRDKHFNEVEGLTLVTL